MEKAQFVFQSWNDLRSHDRRAYEAIRRYAEDIQDGPWALSSADELEWPGARYLVELTSMATKASAVVVFRRQGMDYCVESSSFS